MAALIIGNSFNEYLVGDLSAFDPIERAIGGNISLRLAWLAQPGDVVVLPQEPDPSFVNYMMELKGIDPGDVAFIVPPPGAFGTDVLTRDRLTDASFNRTLAERLDSRCVDRIFPYVFDGTIAAIAKTYHIREATPGFKFFESGGSDLLNSKCAFRAIASGVGIPIAEGLVTSSVADAEAFAWRFLSNRQSVIVKQDFHQGGHGNEILAPNDEVLQIGAARLSVCGDRPTLNEHLRRSWGIYTSGHRNRVVIERYVEDATPLGAEVEVFATESVLRHVVEMRMTPVFDGVAIPGRATRAVERERCGELILSLCDAIRGIGYRGLINVDGIVGPDGRVLLTEFNGRLGGTTHLHWLANEFIGQDYARYENTQRVVVTNNDWKVASLKSAMEFLVTTDLAFDRKSRRGVIITCDHFRQSQAVEYCVIAPNEVSAIEMEAALVPMQD